MTEKVKLYRSKSDCMVGGVAAGVAKFFGLDTTLVRLIWAVSVLLGGTGLFLYLVAWVIIPPAPEGEATATFEKGEHIRQRVIETAKDVEGRLKGTHVPGQQDRADHHAKEPRQLLGWVLVALGLLFLSRNLFAWFSIGRFWPIILILVGAVLVVQEMRRS